MQETRHSGFGLASCLISMVTFFSFPSMLGLWYNQPWGASGLMATIVVAFVAMIGCFGGGILGIGFRIAGLLQKNRRKVFSVLGVITNGVPFLGFWALGIVDALRG